MKVLRRADVVAKTGLSRARIYEMVNEGTFPKPVPLGERARGWLEHEVDQWIEQCIALRANHSWQPPRITEADAAA
jgi:prophage regulatory protein